MPITGLNLGFNMRLGNYSGEFPHPSGMSSAERGKGWWGVTTLQTNPSFSTDTSTGYVASVRWDKARVIEGSGTGQISPTYGASMSPPYSSNPTNKFIGGFPCNSSGFLSGELQILQIINQMMVSIDVSGCKSATYFDFRFNSLSELDVSDNNLIQTLNVGNNNLTTLDVSSNTALTELICEHNLLTPQVIDDILINLDLNGVSGGTANLTFNSIRTSASDSAVMSLEDKGWTLYYDI